VILLERLKPGLETAGSVLVLGLQGWGGVGRIAASTLTAMVGAERVGECYTSGFPDSLICEEPGFGRLPCLEYHFSPGSKPRLFIVSSDAMLNPEARAEFYETLEHVVLLAKKLGADMVVAVDGILGEEEDPPKVFATTRALAETASKGGEVVRGVVVRGYAGVVVGLSQLHRVRGVGILAPCENPAPNRGAGVKAVKHIVKMLDVDLG